jgi:diaminopimelate epimerase
MKLVKAHAFGNDFLLVERRDAADPHDHPALARAVCNRHRGIGADGLIIYEEGARGRREPLEETGAASMTLLNADGSPSEISGNGVRCLAAWIATSKGARPGASLAIDTEAGVKVLRLLESSGAAFTFRAAMGHPEQIDRVTLSIGGEHVEAVTLRVGNPQCVVLGEVSEARLRSVAAPLAVHPHFLHGTNVELAAVDAPDRVRILIWERGVGPTEASGTGACAAAVAAIRFGGASRDVQVVSPGGTQRVEWTDQGLFLTGSAVLIAEISYHDASRS